MHLLHKSLWDCGGNGGRCERRGKRAALSGLDVRPFLPSQMHELFSREFSDAGYILVDIVRSLLLAERSEDSCTGVSLLMVSRA